MQKTRGVNEDGPTMMKRLDKLTYNHKKTTVRERNNQNRLAIEHHIKKRLSHKIGGQIKALIDELE